MLLITTAIERTWDRSKKILFLGHWCCRYSRRELWDNFDAKVHFYHWDDREKYSRDFDFLTKCYEKNLSILAEQLNLIHNTKYSKHFWRILVGPWLRFFIDAVFDRYETVRTAKETNEVSGSLVLPYSLDDWAPNDFKSFYNLLNDDDWNHVIFAECIQELSVPRTCLQGIPTIKPVGKNLSLGPRFNSLAKNLLSGVSRLIPSNLNRIVFVSPYLSLTRLAKLQLNFNQVPYLLPPLIKTTQPVIDRSMREGIETDDGDSSFLRIVRRLVPRLIPRNYVEGFKNLRSSAFKKYPKKPRLIFTANAYQEDDGFKIWSADQRSKMVPLIIGQHGGNMGIARHNQTEDHQILTANRFCSWGWTRSGATNILPMPSLQLSNQQLHGRRDGYFTLVLADLPRYFYCHFSMPVAGQFLTYLSEQYGFINCLDSKVRKRLKIRLNGDQYGWDIRQRFKSRLIEHLIDDRHKSLSSILQRSCICIVSYNATVILQLLAANYPVVAFWNPKYFEIRSEAENSINSLKRVGILHDSYESAASMVNEMSSDISSWWLRSDLQDVRADFCNNYSRTSNQWIKEWTELLSADYQGDS